MLISYDSIKRQKTLDERGLDFEDAPKVFASYHTIELDDRFDYGEDRWITTGILFGRVIVMVWTERDEGRRIISMRKANEDEQGAYYEYVDRPG